MILTACQPEWGYFMPRGKSSVYIVSLYLHVCNLSFLALGYMMSSRTGSNGNGGMLQTFHILITEALPLDAVMCHSQDIPFLRASLAPSRSSKHRFLNSFICCEYSQSILSPVDRAINRRKINLPSNHQVFDNSTALTTV